MNFPEPLEHLITADTPLASRLWLGIGGPARYFAQPTNAQQVIDLTVAAKQLGLPVRILGGGSNVLVRESGVDGLVIALGSDPGSPVAPGFAGVDANPDALQPSAKTGLSINGNILTVDAGINLSHAVVHSVGGGLAGLEHLIGIPGTVAGGVVGNASAGGRDIGSVVHSVDVVGDSAAAAIETLTREQIQFSHRQSSLGDRPIVSVSFSLENADVLSLTKRMQKLWISRNAARPTEQPRIAMPFVDPDGMPAGNLLQSVGLAGIREGAVGLDSVRPQYLVASTGATSDQCLKLIERVRQQVLLQTGVDLQLNLQIW